LSGLFGKRIPLRVDVVPIARFDGVEELFDFGRNFLLSAAGNGVDEVAAGAAKLTDFASDDFFGFGRWGRGGAGTVSGGWRL